MKGLRLRGRTATLAILIVASVLAATLVGSTDAARRGQGPDVVWLEQGANNPYWDAQHKAAAEAGRRLGFNYRTVSGNNSVSDQAALLKQLADQSVDVVMLNAINPKAMGPSLKYATSKGVKVVNLYGTLAGATANITFDEPRSGRVAARYALGLLRQRYGKVEGEVAVLTGILGQPASDLRAKGFTDFMKRQSGVKVVAVQPTGWQADKASATMQNWLVKYPNLSLVYALSDTLAVPALNVAERQNRVCTQQDNWEDNERCIAFISVDGIFVNEVQKGRLFATELYSPEWSGYLFAKLANQVAKGQRFKRNNVINSLLVTPENAACVSRLQSDMVKKIRTFPFSDSLQQIAEKSYRCKVLDRNQ